MNHFFRSILLTLCAAAAVAVSSGAVPPSVHITVSPDTVLIGDRFRMEVSVEKDIMQMVVFPELDNGDAELPVEIVSQSGIDTVTLNGRTQILRKTYELTSFDTGHYDMGHYPILYGDKNVIDTLFSAEPIIVVVNTIPVDTENESIFDIKPPMDAPFMFSEIAGYLFGGLGILLVMTAVAVILVRWLRKRRAMAGDADAEADIPPHVRAIQDLESLHNRKLWQNGKIKTYYTDLTDIIRTYLEGRYGINAMEMTSDQIIRSAGRKDIPKQQSEDLKKVLRTADLVKFAKYTPSDEEHEKYYYAMYYFVEETKYVPQEDSPETESSETTSKNG